MKRIILILLAALMLTGCSGHESGTIEDRTADMYYVENYFYEEAFRVLNVRETDDNVELTMTVDSDIDTKGGIYNTEPGTYIITNVSKDMYTSMTGGKPVFLGTFNLITVINPENGYYFNYINDDRDAALRQAKYDSDYSAVIPSDEIEDVLRKWKFVYARI